MVRTEIERTARGRMGSGTPNPVDLHVGRRLRKRRTLLGLSQENLAKALGVTFQQIQKYEKGANRLGASRLFDLARILNVGVEHFFEEMDADVAANSPAQINGNTPDLTFESEEGERSTLTLVNLYKRLTPEMQDKLRQIGHLMVKS